MKYFAMLLIVIALGVALGFAFAGFAIYAFEFVFLNYPTFL